MRASYNIQDDIDFSSHRLFFHDRFPGLCFFLFLLYCQLKATFFSYEKLTIVYTAPHKSTLQLLQTAASIIDSEPSVKCYIM